MLPSDRLALSVLRFARSGASDGWRPTSLPALANAVNCNDWMELTDSLKNLHHRRVLQIRKWVDPAGFVLYEGDAKSSEFFHRGEFQLSITFEGRPYFEMLEEHAKRPVATATAGAENPISERSLTLTPMAMALAELSPATFALGSHLGEVFERIAADQKQFQESFRAIFIATETQTFLEQQRRLAAALEPAMETFRLVGKELAAQVTQTNQLFRHLGAIAPRQEWFGQILEQSSAITRVNLELPKLLAEAWAPNILGERLALVGDTLKNVTLWEKWRDEVAIGLESISHLSKQPIALDVAGQFVFGHSTLVRRLPPTLPADDESKRQEEQFRYRDEEIGAKLETRLAALGPQFLELRRSAWKNLQSGGIAGARIAMASIRELSSDILHLLSPDEEVKKTDIWLQRKDQKLSKPTRRMRIEFIAGPAVETFDALVQFDESMQHAHKFTHTFADDPELVRIALAQLENCVYMLLISSKR